MVEQHPRQYRFGKANTFTILFDSPKELTFLDVYRKTGQALSEVAYTSLAAS